MSGVHSIIPPSSASIWGSTNGCTGWVLMSQQYPEIDDGGIESEEGEAAHEIGADLINRAAVADNGSLKDYDGKPGTNGIIYNEEMFDAAKLYADDVTDVMRTNGIFGGDNFGVEQKLLIKSIHEYCYGTPDMFLNAPHTKHIYLWDFKFGFKVIEVYENWQLLTYLAGLVSYFGWTGLDDQNIFVHLRVIQPRAHHRDGPVREWVVRLSDLRGYFNTLRSNAAIALSNDSVIRSGPHCEYCTARHACPVALKAGLGLYEVSSKPVPMELTPEALGVQLAIVKRARKALEYLETGFEQQVKSLTRSGVNVPGWSAEMGFGRVAWNRPVPEIIALGNMMKKDLRKPDEVITPNAAIKLGIDETLVDTYTKKPETGLKIVRDTGNKAKQIFSR